MGERLDEIKFRFWLAVLAVIQFCSIFLDIFFPPMVLVLSAMRAVCGAGVHHLCRILPAVIPETALTIITCDCANSCCGFSCHSPRQLSYSSSWQSFASGAEAFMSSC